MAPTLPNNAEYVGKSIRNLCVIADVRKDPTLPMTADDLKGIYSTSGFDLMSVLVSPIFACIVLLF